MASAADPYQLLGLDRGADERAIKRTYRRLAKRYHPDTASGADIRHFLAIQRAYEILSDPQDRREWDRRHPSSGRRPGSASRGADGAAYRWASPAPGGDGAGPRREWGEQPRDERGRFARGEPAVPWWEEIRTPDAVRPEVPGSRGEPGLGPSAGGAAWSAASRAYFRRLTRPEGSSAARRDRARGDPGQRLGDPPNA